MKCSLPRQRHQWKMGPQSISRSQKGNLLKKRGNFTKAVIVYKDKPVCAVTLLLDYLDVRGRTEGPLFCWPDNKAISRSYFNQCLSQAIIFSCLDSQFYKSHSFRIGAASWAAAKGMSNTQIRHFGRWKSNAFLRYIRTSTLDHSLPS